MSEQKDNQSRPRWQEAFGLPIEDTAEILAALAIDVDTAQDELSRQYAAYLRGLETGMFCYTDCPQHFIDALRKALNSVIKNCGAKASPRKAKR